MAAIDIYTRPKVDELVSAKLDAPTGAATAGRILAAKAGGGTEWVAPPSGTGGAAIEHINYTALITA